MGPDRTGERSASGLFLTRRRLLQGAGWVVAAAARPQAASRVPRKPDPTYAETAYAAAAPPEVSSVMTTLSTYMSEAASRRLPDAVVEKTKHLILDTLAAMVSGSELPPGRFAIQFARAYGGDAPVSRGEDGLAALEVLWALKASAERDGRRVDIATGGNA